MTEVAAFMTTMNFWPAAETSAAASAFGVSEKPPRISAWSRTTSFLRQPFGEVGRDAARVLADELDLLAGNRVAVLLHVQGDAVVDLGAGVGELTGILVDHPDLDRLLRVGCAGAKRQHDSGERQHNSFRIAPSRFL